MTVRSRLAALAFPLLLGACAVDGAAAPGQAASPAPRGQWIAEQQCGACHALGAAGDSRQVMAPPFRTLARRYNPLSLRPRIADVAAGRRHGEMPPIRLEPSEIDDLAAYIASLERP